MGFLKSRNSKDVTVFTSHFGVKFGLIICHEINFASPLRSMISAGVRDVIFPTQWGGPYGGNFAATQSGFAIAHQVNLLSANGMSGGSGIWPANYKKSPVQFLADASLMKRHTVKRWFLFFRCFDAALMCVVIQLWRLWSI